MKPRQPMRTAGRWLALGVLGAAALAPSARGQTYAVVATDYENIWYPQGNAVTAFAPVSALCWCGSGPITNAPANLVISDSQFGMAAGAIEAYFTIGQALPAPLYADTNTAPILSSNSTAVWIDYAHQLFATDAGAVNAQWHVLNSPGLLAVTYVISPESIQRPVRIYWTEGAYQGSPLVSLPQAPTISEIYYNAEITGTNQVWIDGSFTLHAQAGTSGKFLLAYSQKDTNGVQFLLGTEVVEVLEPIVNVQSFSIGQRLLPASVADYGTTNLTTRITRGLEDDSKGLPAYVYVHSAGSQSGWVYAIRPTEAPWEVEIFWMSKSLLDVLWPFEVDNYNLGWSPDTQLYVRGDAGSTNQGPAVLIPGDVTPTLMAYQDPPGHAVLNGQSFSTTQPGYALLQYTRGDAVAFDAVHSVLHTSTNYFDLVPHPWSLGVELAPKVRLADRSLAFAGGYAQVPDPGGQLCATQALTIETWVWPQPHNQWVGMFQKGTNAYVIGLDASNQLFYASASQLGSQLSGPAVPLAQWTHVAVVVQAGTPGRVSFYLNGQLVSTALEDASHPVSPGQTNTADLIIGSVLTPLHPGATAFPGYLDEVRVWAAALDGRTITAWMNSALDPTHPFFPFLRAQFRFEEGGGTSTQNTLGSGPPYGFLVGNVTWLDFGALLYGDPSLVAPYQVWPGYVHAPEGNRYNPDFYHYPAAASDTPPVSQLFAVNTGTLEVWWANRSAQPDMSLAVYWPSMVNRYTNSWPADPPQIVIASGLGNAGYAVEHAGAECLSFNGTNAYLAVQDSPSLELGDSFTLEGFVYPTTTNGSLTIVSKGSDEYTLQLRNGQLVFANQATGQLGVSDPARPVPANQWTHVALTFAQGPGGLHFYVAGLPAGTAAAPGALPTGTGALAIGRRTTGGAGTDYFTGQLDEIRFWSRVRSADEIRQNRFFHVDPTDPNLVLYYRFDDGDVAGGVVTDWSGYANAALVFNAIQSSGDNGVPWAMPGPVFTGQNPTVYYQNDPSQIGYNPNEEHALRVGDSVYALRDDLNLPTTSDPYVLVELAPPALSPRMAFTVLQVLRTNEIYDFNRSLAAGTMIQAPLPISGLYPPNCPENYYTDTTAAFTDRLGYTWAMKGGDTGGTTNVTMKFYYPVEAGFYFPFLPASQQPAVGTHVPWLSGQNLEGAPIDCVYTASWPANVPVLNVVGTLIEQRDGLPAIRGQKSVGLVYQQSVTTNTDASIADARSVVLIDPTVARTAPLADLATGIQSYVDPGTGYTFFSGVPPDLTDRLYFNPTASAANALQLIGEFKQFYPNAVSPYDYLRLNLLTPDQLQQVLNIPGADAAWTNAVAALPSTPVILNDDVTPFDSIALSAGIGRGRGYVSLIFNNSVNPKMVSPGDPISMQIILVDRPLYVGELDVIQSSSPLDTQLNLRYTADFAGQASSYEFEWQYADTDSPTVWYYLQTATNLPAITIGGSGVFGLSDHWIRCRYRAVDPVVQAAVGTNASDWTASALAEGWIKRALNAINPYEQRIQDYQSGLLTTVDMIAQAGPPYTGPVPMNDAALNQNGLIAIYQTILEQGRSLSIDAGINDPGANSALLLAAGRLSDLYMLLGNEAYAEALDPTISLGTDDPVWGSMAPSIFCFMNQEPTLMDQELALLRGRDDSQSPGVNTYPVYNRLFWNFTQDLDGGEVAYALNFGMPDADGNVAGTITQPDAQALYPQGHGDAYGHYLSAVTGYYELLRNTNFVWIPQSEQVNVGNTPVGVSYLHEQKFCQSAAAKALTGALIVSDTYRSQYTGDGGSTWNLMRDSNTNRAWGLAEWASRTGQGAYFDWLVGNALLPAHDPNAADEGIALIDRQTVPELLQVAAQGGAIQNQIDNADGGLNPLGLAPGVVPFDISPADVDAGLTHYEQIYARALTAWQNALGMFDNARDNVQAMRNQDASDAKFNQALQQQMIDFTNQLVTIYGYPYSDDIGPGQIYPQGYQGPDLIHYTYVDAQDLLDLGAAGQTITMTFTNQEVDFGDGTPPATIDTTVTNVSFYLGAQGIPSKPDTYTGQRRAEGTIQMALKDCFSAIYAMESALDECHVLNAQIQNQLDLINTKSSLFADTRDDQTNALNTTQYNNGVIASMGALSDLMEVLGETSAHWGDALAEDLPTSLTDMTSTLRGTAEGTGAMLYTAATGLAIPFKVTEQTFELQNEVVAQQLELAITANEQNAELATDLAELRNLLNEQEAKLMAWESAVNAADKARMQYAAVVAQGQRVQVSQQVFLANSAGQLQAERYRNMAFRMFRDDALQKYTDAFDLAARYVDLAVRAYDYETALPVTTDSTLSGQSLSAQVSRTRSLGRCTNPGETYTLPQPLPAGDTGDGGLADIMARMQANWIVLQGRYGFNNPETETGRFSLRTELFRIPPDAGSDATWEAELSRAQYQVTNLLAMPEFVQYCLPFDPAGASQPALVIPFQTTIQFGQNFFGKDLAAGDHAYDSSRFATKIRSVGVWFNNYTNTFNISTTSGGGLAATPRVYLIPVGLDMMRIPSNDNKQVRTWQVFDQALPVPFPFTPQDLLNPNYLPVQDSVNGSFGSLRKYPALLAYGDTGSFDPSQVTGDSRLIGRSVWNTQWLLIIPGGALLSDGQQGIQRFIHGSQTSPGVWDGNGVKDILIFFQTYSYSGN